MRIIPAHQQAAVLNGGGYRAWLQSIITARWAHDIEWEVDEDAPPIVAHVSRGDWVAKCDLNTEPPCGGSMVVTYEAPDNFFLCDECVNFSAGHKLRRVKFPSQKNRLIIEELLTARPHPGLRNYRPQDGDTVAIVQQENKEQPWIK